VVPHHMLATVKVTDDHQPLWCPERGTPAGLGAALMVGADEVAGPPTPPAGVLGALGVIPRCRRAELTSGGTAVAAARITLDGGPLPQSYP
jgi:hypothetical protein